MKITRPRVAGVVQRERLFRLLDDGRTRPITWVSGPAGSGKTTLVASYLDSRAIPCLWYQVDGGDADPASFFYYLGLAAKKAAPRNKRQLPLLTPEYLRGLPTFTRRYFEHLYSRLKPPFVLVFDNYQDVPVDSHFHEIALAGLSLLPEGISAVLISRSEPPPALSRLRANSQMQVLGWSALPFNEDEAESMFSLKGERLSKETRRRINDLTGGWAAGMVLLMEDAKTGEGGAIHLPGTGSRESIFDYFASEIFRKAEPSMRDILVKTAYLTAMTERAAERLSGSGDAGRILSEMVRKNYFIYRHAGPEPVYEYHPLFKDFLRSRALSVLGHDEALAVRRAAAALLLEAGQVVDALGLYFECGDWKSLAQLLITRGQEFMGQGRSGTLRAWLDRIPGPVAEQTPWILFWMGICRMPTGFPEARGYFERAFRTFTDKGDRPGALLAWSYIVDMIIFEYDNLVRLEPWIEWLSKDLASHEGFPSPEIGYRVTSSMAVALQFTRSSRKDVSPWIDRAVEIMPHIPDISSRCRLAIYLALYTTWTGDLARLKAITTDIHAWSRTVDSGSGKTVETLYALYVQTLLEWIGGIGDCGYQAALDAFAVAEESGIHIIDNHLATRAAFGALSLGDLRNAKKYIDLIKSVAPTSTLLNLRYIPAWYSLLSGNFPEALQEAEISLQFSRESKATGFYLAFSNLIAAYALLEMKRTEESRPFISEVLDIAREMESPVVEFSGLLLQAQSLLCQVTPSVREQGWNALRTALAIGSRQGYRNTVVWYPPAMAYLCARALGQNVEVRYVQEIIIRRGLTPPSAFTPLDNWPWRFDVSALGGFELHVDGKPLAFAGKTQKKPLDLLKALVAFGGRNVAEHQLSEALWPDAEGDLARRAFDTTLHRLRKMLGDDRSVFINEGKVTLHPRLWRVDVWTFEGMFLRAEQLLRNNGTKPSTRQKKESSARASETVVLLEKAVRLYKGHFLASDSDCSWTVPMRERLQSKFFRLIVKAGGYFEEAGDYERAMELFRKGLDIDNLIEEFYQHLMLCCAHLGRKSEALSLYHQCRAVLAAALGIAPSQRTEEIYSSLMDKR